MQTEDLPDPNNRVRVVGDKLNLDYILNNTEAAHRLVHGWKSVLKSIERNAMHIIPFSLYPGNNIPLLAVSHQAAPVALVATQKPVLPYLVCSNIKITLKSSNQKI